MTNTPIVIALTLFGLTTAATAQTTHHHAKAKTETVKALTPPDSVMTAFQAKYSGDSAVWQMSPAGNYCAVITSNGQKEYAEFSPGGEWLHSRTDLTPDQLPDNAKAAIQTKYPGMEIATVQKLEYGNVNPFFKVDLKQGDQSKEVMVNTAGYTSED
jgi:hypothetical protein